MPVQGETVPVQGGTVSSPDHGTWNIRILKFIHVKLINLLFVYQVIKTEAVWLTRMVLTSLTGT